MQTDPCGEGIVDGKRESVHNNCLSLALLTAMIRSLPIELVGQTLKALLEKLAIWWGLGKRKKEETGRSGGAVQPSGEAIDPKKQPSRSVRRESGRSPRG
mmetsp:Transcript_43429/g.85700  ORF Transcript_43429/g.85700 Transcript_43429/m.85700 type:complete len:100 (-) Transcript_43429:160-459(-)